MKSLHVLIIGLALSPLGGFADIIYPDGHVPTVEPYQIRKIARGINNLVSAPLEIPKAVFDIGEQEGVLSPTQFSLGLVRGPVNMFLRYGQAGNDLVYWGPNDDKPLLHLEPQNLGLFDAIPGWQQQFDWETIDTPAFREDTPKTPSWR